MNELEEAVKLFGREDLLSDYGIQDVDTNIEVFLSVKDMIKYYKQGKEIKKLNNIINELEKYIKESCWKDSWGVESVYVKTLLNKLQELKGSDKE